MSHCMYSYDAIKINPFSVFKDVIFCCIFCQHEKMVSKQIKINNLNSRKKVSKVGIL